MSNLLSGMSNSVKGLAMLMAMLLPVVMMASMRYPNLIIWFMGVYIILGVVGGLGVFFAGKSKKKKASKFAEDIEENTKGSVPGQDAAKLEEMRRVFKTGVDKYKEYGKDLYSLPWFLMIGESGSGKTEAIRRGELNFPPGLHDYWQGTGGTLSMHWWFTNDAVILDTAGRLVISDSERNDNASGQWIEFLKMLKGAREDCPINGLCLAIPVTSLIRKASDGGNAEVERRIDDVSGQIARQLNILRKELKVKFPVYIIITKSDKLIGFREHVLEQANSEHRFQMIGWSNPGPIDAAVDTGSVRKHFVDLADKFRSQRAQILKDPLPSGSSSKRIDELDALYAFPNSIEDLAPNIERYLNNIFSSGGWSSDPPFLRGVYLTSALQQGAVLDESIANAMGMSMDDYAKSNEEEDLSLSKNRSYFLRDLFLEKVFRETGLVLKEGITVKKMTGWRRVVMLTFVVIGCLIALLGWITGMNKPEETDQWEYISVEAYSTKDGGFYPLFVKNISGNWSYRRNPIEAEELLSKIHQLGKNDLDSSPDLGWVMAPATWMDSDVKNNRVAAYKNVIDGIILSKLIEASVDGLLTRSEKWKTEPVSRNERKALFALLEVHGKMKADTEKQLEAMIRISGLKFYKRGRKQKEITEPLFSSVKSVYPNGCLTSDFVDKGKLTTIVDRLFTARNSSLLPVLKKYDKTYSEISNLNKDDTFSDYGDLVRSLESSSKELSGLSGRIANLLASAGKEEEEEESADLSSPLELGIHILDEYEKSVKELAAEQHEDWEMLIEDSDEGNSENKQKELILVNKYCLEIENVKRHILVSKLLREIIELHNKLENPKSMRAVLSFSDTLKNFKDRAKKLEESEVVTSFIEKSLDNYFSVYLKKEIAFPLVFNKKVGELEKKELKLEHVGAIAVLLETIGSNSNLASERCQKILTICKCLVDMEAAREGNITAKKWEITLKNDWIAANTVYVKPTSGPNLKWNYDTGGESREINCSSGAKLWFEDNNAPPKKYNFKSGNSHDNWAPVYWLLSQIGSGRAGVEGTLGKSKLEIRVKPQEGFPRRSLELPTTKDL